MSEANVEVVRGCFEAFQRGGPEAMVDLLNEDVLTYRADPDRATFQGRAGFLAAAADWSEDYSEWQILPREFTDLGDQVLVLVLQIAEGRSSGVRVEEDFWFLFEVAGGQVSKVSFYSREADALDAARPAG